MSEVERSGTNRRMLRARLAWRINGARRETGGERRMHRRGLPNGFRDCRNRAILGLPMLIRIAVAVRAVSQQARPGRGHRADAVCRRGPRACGGPQKSGDADREKDQATHSAIVTCHSDTVKPPVESLRRNHELWAIRSLSCAERDVGQSVHGALDRNGD